MVHADSSNFAPDMSKKEAYSQVLAETRALVDGQRNWVCNLANTSSLLWYALKSLPSPSNCVNWAGFYVLESGAAKGKNATLILGPFQGKVACQTIKFGRGVCGAAAESGKTQLVSNVAEFPGHIACDQESASEIVVPLRSEGRVVAVLDIDCSVVSGFDLSDQVALEEIADLLAQSCDWDA